MPTLWDDLPMEGQQSAPAGMPSLFDDLIPQARRPNLFDDLPMEGEQPSRLDAIGRSAANAMTFNLADEAVASARVGSPYAGIGDRIASGMEAVEGVVPEWLLGPSEYRDRAKEGLRSQQQEFDRFHAEEQAATQRARAAYPGTSLAADIGGGLGTGLGMANKGLSLMNAARPTAGNMAARGAAEGGLYGAAYGFGAGEGLGDRLGRAATGAAISAPFGGVLGAGAGALAQRGAARAVPSADELKIQADPLYDIVKNSGVTIKPEVYRAAVADVAQGVKSAGFHPRIHPKVAAALDEFSEAANEPVGLGLVDQLRRIAGSAAKSIEPDERRIASIMIDKIDDLVSALGQADVIGPDPTTATKAITAARAVWSKARKVETIEELVERARDSMSQFSQSGFENALRTQFRALVKNRKRMRGFTKDETAALKRISRGGVIGNIMRDVGKLSPIGGSIPITGHILAAIFTGGTSLPMQAGAITAGSLARLGAKASTEGRVDLARALVSSGGKLPDPKPLSATRRSLIDAIMAGQAAGAN